MFSCSVFVRLSHRDGSKRFLKWFYRETAHSVHFTKNLHLNVDPKNTSQDIQPDLSRISRKTSLQQGNYNDRNPFREATWRISFRNVLAMNARNKEVVPPVFTGDCIKVIRSVVFLRKDRILLRQPVMSLKHIAMSILIRNNFQGSLTRDIDFRFFSRISFLRANVFEKFILQCKLQLSDSL